MASDFLLTYGPLANDIATRTGLDPAVVLGIIDTETSAGTRVLSNNIFGISPGGKGGQYVARYPDVQAGAEAFITLMQQPRYAKVLAAETPQAQAQALVAAGYNTVDRGYATKVGNRAAQFGQQLGYQEQTPAAAPAAQPGEDPRMGNLAKTANGAQPAATATPAAPAATAPPPASGEDPRMGDLERLAATPPPGRTGIMGAYDTVTGAVGAAKDAVVQHYTTPPDPAQGSSLGRVIDATVQGFRNAPNFYAPGFHEQVAQGPVGRFITNPLLDTASGVMGAISGGAGQTAYEAGNALGGPQMGRDFYMGNAVLPAIGAMPGVIRPGGGPVTPGTIVRNTLQPWEEARTPAPVTAEAFPKPTIAETIDEQLAKLSPEQRAQVLQQMPGLKEAIEKRTAAEQQAALERQGGGAADVVPETPEQAVARTQADQQMQPGTGADRPIQPTRKAAGAAPTTDAIPEKTIDQRITDLDKDLGQTVADRADAGRVPGSLRDENVYIEGMPERTEAHKDLSNQAAIDHKALMQSGTDTGYKSAHEANLRERNDHMTENVAKPIIGDRNSIAALKEERLKVTPESMDVFTNEKPVDPAQLADVSAQLDRRINSYTANNPIRKSLEKIREDLNAATDANGVTLPSELRKVRDTMTGILERTGGSDEAAATNRQLRQPITEMVNAIDPVMQTGAPRWGEWRQAWEQASRPINAQEFLEPYRPGGTRSLWNKEGLLELDRVQRLLRDIADDHRNPTGMSKGLTEDAIQAFVNMRNELAPGFISDVRGRVKGSSTPQMLEAQFRLGMNPKLQTALELGAHAASLIGSTAAGVLPVMNFAVGGYQMAKPTFQRWAAEKQARTSSQYNALIQEHLLNEAGDRSTSYPNPLTFKPVKPSKFITPPPP